VTALLPIERVTEFFEDSNHVAPGDWW
jgi:hypothetical protein